MKKIITLFLVISSTTLVANNWFDNIIKNDPLFDKLKNGEYSWPNKINVHDTINDPIFKSVLSGDVSNLSILLENGANPNRVGLNDHTPLICAARLGKPKVVYELLKYGSEVNHFDKLGWTALHHAFHKKSADLTVVKILLNAGADPNMVDHRKRTPLHRAAQYGSAETVLLKA